MESLSAWSPNSEEEVELELHAELWCRLGRLALEVKTNAMSKVGLYSAETAINGVKEIADKKLGPQTPVTRLRWYSVAESLYGESLFSLVDENKQEKES